MAQNCEICGTGPYKNIAWHEKSKAHQANLTKSISEEVVEIEPVVIESLPPDLQRPVDAIDETPQNRAKMVRIAFSSLGRPDKEHSETVREFMIKHNIPCIDKP